MFQRKFFRTTIFQLKLLIFIEFPNISYWKTAKKIKVGVSWGKIWANVGPVLWKKVNKHALSIDSFHNFHGKYL